jgi:outer membrane protein TolC
MGAGLDDVFVVDDLTGAGAPRTVAGDAEAGAVRARPEARLAVLNQSLADVTQQVARAAFLPQVSATATWEADGGRWGSRSSGWTAGIVARINLFRGFADRARLVEALELQRHRRIERESIETAVRVDVRETRARLDAARATADVAEAAVALAVESHRIVRDRYQGGLTDVSALLRAAEGVHEAEARRVTARVEVIVAMAAWRRAMGK